MVNEWTRDDLPNVNDLVEVSRETLFAGRTDGGVAVLDAVAAHLNAHHPKPEFEGYCTCNGYDSGGLMGDCGIALHRAQYRANLAEADADRWRRAHEIVEGERDQARASLHEACKVAQSYKVDAYQATERAESAEHESDEWKSRAEAAERERDEWQTRAEKSERERDGAMQARNTALVLVSQAQDERDEALDRAEAAEARTAPAVTHAEIEMVIDQTLERLVAGDWIPTPAADAVWSLVSGDDPAVHVVRESDVADVEVEPYGDTWKADGRVHIVRNAAEARNDIRADAESLKRSLAVARAIEAEAAPVDPVEDAAVAAFKAAWHRADEEGDEGNRVRRGIRAARDVLGQEAKR